jgi:diadenosine tetraphosphate (Ap4A) HIT family hydrolase
MNPAALAALGPTLALVTAAIEAVLEPQRVYCSLFSEQTRAVHFHLFPRTEWLTAKYFAAHPESGQDFRAATDAVGTANLSRANQRREQR